MKPLRVGSLFSGAGLGDLGLEWAGMEHAFFVEIDDYAQKVLKLRYPGVPVYEDITQVRGKGLPECDLLIGGFPCQDLSHAGKRAGLDGARSGLWGEFHRLICEIRPRYVIVENVPGLLSLGMGTVLGDLALAGYDAEWRVFCSGGSVVDGLGGHHKRERVFIVAYPGECRRLSGKKESQRNCQRELLHHQERNNTSSLWTQEFQSGAVGDGDGLAPNSQIRERRNMLQDHMEHHQTGTLSQSGNGGREATLSYSKRRTRELRREDWRVGRFWELAKETLPGDCLCPVIPKMGGVADACPFRVDRLRCIGNGIDPEVSAWIGKRIMEYEEKRAQK